MNEPVSKTSGAGQALLTRRVLSHLTVLGSANDVRLAAAAHRKDGGLLTDLCDCINTGSDIRG